MAVDTSVSTKYGASSVALGNCLKVYEREIDFATYNLASGAWFEIIHLPKTCMVIAGFLETITTQATLTLALGYGGGHELLDASTHTATEGIVALSHTMVTWPTTTGGDDVSILAGAATASTAKVRVWLLVLERNGGTAD